MTKETINEMCEAYFEAQRKTKEINDMIADFNRKHDKNAFSFVLNYCMMYENIHLGDEKFDEVAKAVDADVVTDDEWDSNYPYYGRKSFLYGYKGNIVEIFSLYDKRRKESKADA